MTFYVTFNNCII